MFLRYVKKSYWTILQYDYKIVRLYLPLFYWGTKNCREVDFVIEKGGRFIGFEAKLTGMPSSDTAKGFEYLKEYYGENSLLKGFVVCRVKKDFQSRIKGQWDSV